MTDMKEAMREAQAHAARVTRAKRDRDKQIAAAVVRANDACNRKVDASLKALSPAAARIVVAAEIQEHVPPEVFHTAPNSGFVGKGVVEQLDEPLSPSLLVATGTAARQAQEAIAEKLHHGPLADLNPAPDWMNREPDRLPPGSMVVVEEGKKARRA